MRAIDTREAADAIALQYWRDLSPAERVRRGFELCDLAREVVRAGIRARHPDYSPENVEAALVRLELNDDALFTAAWPNRPLLPR